MKRFLTIIMAFLPAIGIAGDYESTLLVQTGKLRESDLIVRTVTDLESSRICLTFYIRTEGTSPAMTCYDASPGFRAKIRQVGHFKDGNLVLRKLHDSVNQTSCLVAYVSAKGTAPVIDCYKVGKSAKDTILRKGHLQEGDLHVHRIVDPESSNTCLVAHVGSVGTSPAMSCYTTSGRRVGGIEQTSHLREGDMVVRKIQDVANAKECLITYVSTEGTSPYIYCADSKAVSRSPATVPGSFAPAAKK